MNINLKSSYKNNDDIASYLIALLIFSYALFSDPFIFFVYSPEFIRVCFLIIPLLLISYAFFSSNLNLKLLMVTISVINIMYLLNNTDTQISSFFKVFIQILFFTSLFTLSKYKNLICKLSWFWFWLWLYISICIIGTFIVFKANIFTITPAMLKDSGNADYYYYSIPILGNYVNYYLLGYKVPKSSWYAFEPGMLSYFFAFNVVLSRYIFTYVKSVKKVLYFKYANMIAGTLTFSSTYFLFLLLYFFVSFVRNRNTLSTKILMFIIVIFLLVLSLFFIFDSGVIASTSADDRLFRFKIFSEMFLNSNIFEFFFGYGSGSPVAEYGRGLASGLLTIFIENGFLFLVIFITVLNKYTKNKNDLFFVMIFYLLTFNPIFYPMTAIGFLVAYNCNSKLRGISTI